jgi:hypothetical protein
MLVHRLHGHAAHIRLRRRGDFAAKKIVAVVAQSTQIDGTDDVCSTRVPQHDATRKERMLDRRRFPHEANPDASSHRRRDIGNKDGDLRVHMARFTCLGSPRRLVSQQGDEKNRQGDKRSTEHH